MSTRELINTEDKLGYLNLLVMVLSIYILVALLIDTFYALSPEVSQVLTFVDTGICVFFLIEFSIRLYKAKSKLKFLKWGWIDLLSSIPALDVLRPGRIFRLIRLLRIVRAFRSVRQLVQHVFHNKIHGTFTSVTIFAILMLIFSSIAILLVEDDPESNIKSAEDAIWWAYATITTVGYGDKYPVTTEGRIIAAFLMTTGVGLFGTFAGYVASWFVSEKEIVESEHNKN